MEIYQCMSCGERWAHEGLEVNMDRAITHQSRGHNVFVGHIDVLAKQYEAVKNGAAIPAPDESVDPRPVSPEPEEEHNPVFGLPG